MIVYPEGTASRDPGLWPMVGKTGAARLALTTGAPVIPIAHWGAQDILPYGSKKLRLFPRKTVRMAAGPPVDLSAYAGRSSAPAYCARPPPTSWPTSRPCWRRSGTRRRPPYPTIRPWLALFLRTERTVVRRAESGATGAGEARGANPPPASMKAAVMGAGSWGTTFAQVLCDAGTATVLHARRAQLAKARRNATRTRTTCRGSR